MSTITETISLEALEQIHAAALWDCIQQNKQYLQQWIAWIGHCQSEAQVAEYIREAQDKAERQEGITMLIRQQSRIIGIISLQDWNRVLNLAELGFWIAEPEQGKGLMQEAIKQMLQFGCKQLGLQKIEATCAANNTRVLRLLQYMGFKIEGVLRRSTQGKGLLTDKVVLGMLKEEWH